jgi:phospholipid/cholesterol/gamma-HCH transport system permease protein
VSTPDTLIPRSPSAEDQSFLARLGALGLGALHQALGLVQTLLGALAAPFAPGKAAARVCSRIAIRQVFFTGFEALPLVSAIAACVGATFVLQVQLLSGALNTEMVGKIFVAVMLRELAPLVTAIVVAGRSGTAIATELGNMKVNDEILGLSSMGIDPMRFIVMPRIIACIVSVLVLTVYFGALAIASGYLVGTLLGGVGVENMRAGFSNALLPWDLPLFVSKGLSLGVLVGWLCCHFGLLAEASPTEVPRRASYAVVMTLLACVGVNALITLTFYWIVGPPVS